MFEITWLTLLFGIFLGVWLYAKANGDDDDWSDWS